MKRALGRKGPFFYYEMVARATPQHLIGNRDLLERLFALPPVFYEGRFYLFAGPKGIGKRTTAIMLSERLLEIETGDAKREGVLHPDFLSLVPERDKQGKEMITVAQARSVRAFLSQTPLVAPRKIVLIERPEAFGIEAANALLKTFEEPPAFATIFLCSDVLFRLLPTIRSRALLVRFLPVPETILLEELLKLGFGPRSAVEEAVMLTNGSPGSAIQLLADPKEKRAAAIHALLGATAYRRLSFLANLKKKSPNTYRELPEFWLSVLRSALFSGKAQAESSTMRKLLRADWLTQTTNASPELLLESAVLDTREPGIERAVSNATLVSS